MFTCLPWVFTSIFVKYFLSELRISEEFIPAAIRNNVSDNDQFHFLILVKWLFYIVTIRLFTRCPEFKNLWSRSPNSSDFQFAPLRFYHRIQSGPEGPIPNNSDKILLVWTVNIKLWAYRSTIYFREHWTWNKGTLPGVGPAIRLPYPREDGRNYRVYGRKVLPGGKCGHQVLADILWLNSR